MSDKKTPLVSVAVITYRQEQYIRRALDSILMQKTDFDFEVVIGEDKSPDNTRAILEEYALKDDRIILLNREKNLGATKNIYDVYSNCKGEFIANLEGDDYWTDEFKLQKQVDWLKSHPDDVAVTHKYRYVSASEEHLPELTGKFGSNSKKDYTLKDYEDFLMPGQLATIVMRNIFKNAKHDYSIIYTADFLVSDRTIALILALSGNVARIDEFMSDYRWLSHGDNISDIDTRDFFAHLCYYKTLKNWAKKEYNIKVSLYSAIQPLFTGAVYQFLKDKDFKNLKIAFKLFINGESRCKLIVGLFKELANSVKIRVAK